MAPVGPKLKGGPLTEVAKLAHHSEPAAPLPRAAAVGNQLVTLDAKRRLPLDDLARRVPDVRRRVGDAVEPVAVGAAAPVAHHRFAVHVERPVGVVSGDAVAGRPPFARGANALGNRLRERTGDRVDHPETGHAAGRACTRRSWVEDRAELRLHRDRAEESRVVRRVRGHHRPQREVHGPTSRTRACMGEHRGARRRRGDRMSVDYATGARTAGTVSAICLEHRAVPLLPPRRRSNCLAWSGLC